MVVAVAIALVATSCHSNETNYKQAYDKAMDKYKTGIGAEAYDRIQAERMKLNTVIDGDSVRMVRSYANVFDDEPSVAHPYNIVVAEFTQQFNAQTMRNRLRDEEGLPSYILYGGNPKKYHVIASGFDKSSEAAQFLKNIDKNVKMQLLVPRAYILFKL